MDWNFEGKRFETVVYVNGKCGIHDKLTGKEVTRFAKSYYSRLVIICEWLNTIWDDYEIILTDYDNFWKRKIIIAKENGMV